LHVVLAVPVLLKGQRVAAEIIQNNASASLSVLECDLACFTSIRGFVDQFLDMKLPLHILVNAAFHRSGNHAAVRGVVQKVKRAAALQSYLSDDGYEMNFAVGYLGHFLLTELLLPKLQQTAFEEGGQTRIVNVCPFYSIPREEAVSSGQHQKATQGASPEGNNNARNASLSLALYASELSRRLASEDEGRRYCPLVTVNACCSPEQTQAALIEDRTGFFLPISQFMSPLFPRKDDGTALRKDAAVAPVIVACDASLRDVSGRCFEGSAPTRLPWPGMHLCESARELYDSSLHMVGLAVQGSPRHRVPLSP
jgi:NAD(P)-dependent dehydrogenase (short-subunit alcohol dehydrogenase family)